MPAACASYDDLNAGIQFHNQGIWTGAISRLDKAIAVQDLPPSQKFVAYLDRGQAHLSLRHFDQALSDYSSSLALRPGDPDALMERALAYESLGKHEEAIADLDTLITASPKLDQAYQLRAAINLARGHRIEGVSDNKTVLTRFPEGTFKGFNHGIIAWLAEDYKQAETNFSYAASTGKGNIRAWFWYALVELRLGKPVPRGDVPDFDKKKWPAPVVDLYLGRSTPDAVLAASAVEDDAAVRADQICEANFYAGEWLLQRQDAGAKLFLQKVVRA